MTTVHRNFPNQLKGADPVKQTLEAKLPSSHGKWDISLAHLLCVAYCTQCRAVAHAPWLYRPISGNSERTRFFFLLFHWFSSVFCHFAGFQLVFCFRFEKEYLPILKHEYFWKNMNIIFFFNIVVNTLFKIDFFTFFKLIGIV